MAGKSKIIREALEGLSDTAQRWFNSIDGGDDLAAWPSFVEKVKSVDQEAPFVFSQYKPNTLRNAIEEAAAGRENLALMNPEDFKMLARKDIEDWLQGGKYFHPDDPATKETYQKIQKYADMYESGDKFDAIPYLQIKSLESRLEVDPNFLKIFGHEGRHRMRGQEKIGSDAALVRILPQRSDRLDLKKEDAKKPVIGQSAGERDEPKSFSDIFKLLSLGGISAGSLGNLVDEDKL